MTNDAPLWKRAFFIGAVFALLISLFLSIINAVRSCLGSDVKDRINRQKQARYQLESAKKNDWSTVALAASSNPDYNLSRGGGGGGREKKSTYTYHPLRTAQVDEEEGEVEKKKKLYSGGSSISQPPLSPSQNFIGAI